ncbi:MAG TPA: TetR/AcrR family transcriptional regulator [Streptosporangiaceae bacterium]|jgi:AcrR family transcriptional regulator
MPAAGKGGRYHHGDLRAALIDTAIELIAERGVRGFSLTEASRRLGVAGSAPYAHFADRDELLAAVAVRAYQQLREQLLPAIRQSPEPAGQLAAMASAYVRFAAGSRPLFEVMYGAGLDKARHPGIEAAERPLTDAFLDCVSALVGDDEPAQAEDLAIAVEATAHGHAALLLDGDFGTDGDAVAQAADRAGRATLALVASRQLLHQPAEEAKTAAGQSAPI